MWLRDRDGRLRPHDQPSRRLNERALGRVASSATCALLVILLAACSTPGSPSQSRPARSGGSPVLHSEIAVGSSPVAGGCAATRVYEGKVPAWLDEASGHNPALGVPYAVATPPIAAGFIFAYPLQAGGPSQSHNKILWVVRTPRNGAALEIDAHPLSQSGPVVHEALPAGSSPGEIYPDGVDVPSPGCWHFTLAWATGRAELDLEYVAR